MGPEGDPSAFLVCRRLSGLDYLVVFWEKTNNPILMYVSKGEGHFVLRSLRNLELVRDWREGRKYTFFKRSRRKNIFVIDKP